MNYFQISSLPTMLSYGMGMDIQSETTFNNVNELRSRILFSNGSISRDISISSTKSLVVYYKRMTTNNANNDDNLVNAFPELFYETEQEKAFRISKMADQ